MNHRSWSVVIPVLLFPMLLLGQTEKTVLNSARVKGGFGGPFFTYSTVGTRQGGGAGGGGAFIIDNFFIGAFGQGENFGRLTVDDTRYDLNIGYGGLWLGYIVPGHKMLHFYASLKVAGGGAILSEVDNDGDIFHSENGVNYEDAAFVLHPEAGIELNFAHWCRMAAVGGYRMMNEVNDIPTFKRHDFVSPTFSLVFRFGGFGYER